MTKVDILQYVVNQTRDYVEALVEIGRENNAVSDSFEDVSRAIWENGDITDVCHAANLGGHIQQLGSLARHFELEVDDVTRALWIWAEVINPS